MAGLEDGLHHAAWLDRSGSRSWSRMRLTFGHRDRRVLGPHRARLGVRVRAHHREGAAAPTSQRCEVASAENLI